ncbi:restriction system protein [Mesonia hippocampi]|uniref:Restriction system protein n=1 Tax=Mesonia hippocampi TaxID=1628250 RepID=A0A840ENV0_9FLAO|nr:restriction endonuclease [Mesonia hippocampi]MBB4118273.1 restriction system protein [Mesonia hippocampi]
MKYELHSIITRQEYTRSNDIKYVAEIQHLGLSKFRVLKDTDSYILRNKINSQFKTWDNQWERQEAKRLKDLKRSNNKAVANEETLEAQKVLENLDNILTHTLKIDDTIDWSTLKDKSKFQEPNPKKHINEELNNLPIPVHTPKPEKPYSNQFKPKLRLLDWIISSKKRKKKETANRAFQEALINWQSKCEKIDEKFDNEIEWYNTQIKRINEKYNKLEEKWKKNKEEFYIEQKEANIKIDKLKKIYLNKDKQAILHYCEIVLNNSTYPEYFPKDFELEYNPENGIIIVEYMLPTLEDMPTLKEVKYITTKDELKKYYITEAKKRKIYDEVIYKITLRTIHELFEADTASAINSVVFNGWVNSINKATGKPVNNCIVSLKTDKKEFEEIDLSQIDPKACFKNLKGIGSSKLNALVSIQPIIQIEKSDKRFTESYDVAIDAEGENLAAMPWEDFEHLIRELFEKEFSNNGGEVKVTQASRDGGVDAIAFDPDPIRGGKIVIQAKRYTNTVGVSAVRDLYGTVLNEGATKGILVTTADYGPDAYNFSKNKPLTLMNGANLLYLLEKHGHKSRIDIKEAKNILKQKE